MKVLHAFDNGASGNPLTYTVLKRDATKQLFFGFSGTKTAQQLITEALQAFPITYPIHPSGGNGVLIVDYFYKYYIYKVRDDILNTVPGILKAHSGYDVIFTGHSLGGAVAVHGAADFLLNGWGQNRTVTIITFGQPRVGNPAFSDLFKPMTAGWYRLDHYHDIVPHVPPCIPGITVPCVHDGGPLFYPYHSSQEIWYDEAFENYTE
mmetsp:Transcript_21419/g.24610  ORF Transcript_21419/g.24610 Transcript_21419/m.24610 type:complete len:207 (+) Transcript_21419:173-793(+)